MNVQVRLNSLNIMMVAFSLTNRLGSGKPKAVWVFNTPLVQELRLGMSELIYYNGHVGWTSISNCKTCPAA